MKVWTTLDQQLAEQESNPKQDLETIYEHPVKIKDLRTPDRIFKVVFVGDSAVGKTCFLHRFCYNRFKPLFSATIGVDFTVKTICVGNRVVALQLWDTAGQERFRSITRQYFRKADGVLVLFDVTSEQSFLNVRNWIESVRLGVDETTIMALVGNKVDLFGNESTRSTVFRAGKKLAEVSPFSSCPVEAFENSSLRAPLSSTCLFMRPVPIQDMESIIA
ncbi:unnamed protein product [Angiostrongylus costaricensis]|uniref:Ras family protein n=1 Tax=Angiostrongylus costaricensis TaxID=334426 RepID=A0A0R3PP61_ANGCS|nr:unnamed protein product [Angiostrongylus costaricensis]